MKYSRQDMERLRTIPVFAGIDPRILEALLDESEVQYLEKSETIFEEGDPADRFFAVLSGWAMVYSLPPDGSEIVLGLFGPGESFAVGALFMQEGYPANARMIDDGRLLRIHGEVFKAKMAENPELAFALIGSMANHLKLLKARIEKGSQKATCRIVEFLLKFSAPSDGASGEAVLRLPFPRRLIASRLGMTPETFSRSLAHLRKHGVEADRKEIRIASVRRVRRLVDRG